MIVSQILSQFFVYLLNHFDIYVFEDTKSFADISTELAYHVWVTSKIQVNFRFNRYSEVLIIVRVL